MDKFRKNKIFLIIGALKIITVRIIKFIFLTKKERIRINRVRQWKMINGDKTLRLDYKLDYSSIVFDVGGYEGQWAKDISEKFNCTIFVFEPVESYAKKIKNIFADNQKIKIYNFGLGKENKNTEITIDNDGSSLFQQGDHKENVRIIRISDFIKENNIKIIDLFKINIEGGEYDLLEDLINTELIKKIKNIQVQFHDFIPDAEGRMKKIQTELAKTHHPTYQYEFVWENWELNDNL